MIAPMFLSYARASSHAAAEARHTALAGAGLTVYLDTVAIEHGETFPRTLAEALLGARVVVQESPPRAQLQSIYKSFTPR